MLLLPFGDLIEEHFGPGLVPDDHAANWHHEAQWRVGINAASASALKQSHLIFPSVAASGRQSVAALSTSAE